MSHDGVSRTLVSVMVSKKRHLDEVARPELLLGQISDDLAINGRSEVVVSKSVSAGIVARQV